MILTIIGAVLGSSVINTVLNFIFASVKEKETKIVKAYARNV